MIINRFQAKEEVQEILQSETCGGDSILKLLNHHAVTPETFLYRLSQILLGIFKITELHYLRFENFIGRNEIQLTKELNIPRTLVSGGVRLKERYCRRWKLVSLVQVLEGKRQNSDLSKMLIRAQRAKFMESGDEVLFIPIAHYFTFAHENEPLRIARIEGG